MADRWIAEAQELDGSWTEIRSGTLRQVLTHLRRFRENELNADRLPPETRARPAPPQRAQSPKNQNRRRRQ